ncbi:MAG: hypothetical protein DI589_22855 [Shinella sp.]|nr:MAG: hypothetical protein DI589_22855 [Shinella sp.]
MKSFLVEVTSRVHVQIDPAKFTPEKMADFNACITDFGVDDDSFERHAKHIARLTVTDGFDFEGPAFVEGYGNVDNAGISSVLENSIDVEIVSALSPKVVAA